MKDESIIKQHPQTWVGRVFSNNGTGNSFRVKAVRRSARGSRYRILLESDLAILSEIGFDSRIFRKNFTPLNDE